MNSRATDRRPAPQSHKTPAKARATQPAANSRPAINRAPASARPNSPAEVMAMQRQFGNRAAQHALAQPDAPVGLAGGAISADVNSAIDQARGGGQALNHPAAAKIGSALGTDFSHVRVHTDAQSDQLNRSLSAQAFTVGSDIFFSHGRYEPGSSSGQALLAHELTHVVQQGAAGSRGPQTKLTVGAAGDRFEQEADQTAQWVVRQMDQTGASQVEPGQRQPLGSVQRAVVLRRAPASIQRSVGFEFQTGWGLIRKLDQAPLAPVGARALDPRPTEQGDYEDEAMLHPNTPEQTRGQRAAAWGRRNILRQQPAPVDPHAPTRVSDTQWRDPDTNSTVTRPDDGVHYKFFKGQVLKDYGDYKLTVDDATTPLGAELEWVIDPPVDENQTVLYMGSIMDQLQITVNRLLQFKDEESFTLDQASGSPADAHIEVQPGIKGDGFRNMAAPAQATGGVGLDQMLTMFKDMGRVGAARSPEATAGQSALAGQGEAAAAAAYAVGNAAPGSARLKGLVAYIYRYLSMGAFLHGQNAQEFNRATPYAKNITLFLARTDFRKMFSMLPQDELDLYGGATYGGDAGRVAAFVAMVTTAITDSGRAINLNRRVFERGIKDADGVTVRNIEVTCNAWLAGIANGTGDLLSSRYQKAAGQPGIAGELESMGNLGNKADKVGADADGVANNSGIVTEFRGQTGQKLPNEWKPYALATFTYLKQLNALPRA